MHAATNSTTGAVGENIATKRKALGWTQSKLAHKAGVSLSLLTKIEVGDRVCTPPTAAAIADALGEPLQVLYGQPIADAAPLDQIQALRAAIRRYDQPSATDPEPEQLAADVAVACQLRADTRYRELLELLPGLIERATVHAHRQGNDDPGAWMKLIEVYGCAYTLVGRLGYPDLAELVAARQRWAATRTWSPVGLAVAEWGEAGAFQAAGDYAGGLAVVEGAISRLQLNPERDGLSALVAAGSLHLRGVVMASRARDKNATEDHTRHAQRLAAYLPPGQDQLLHNLTFGAANTQLHELAAWVDLEKPKKAVEMSEAINRVGELPGLTPTRLGHFHIDSARAHIAAGDREAALQAVNRAREVAPQMARLHPMSREVLRVLVSLHRRSNPQLTTLAKWAGLAR
ncbi:helix-turn-helix domain-containing protein [Streptomyces sp. NPDC101213]|uniref:helix-turn-helix domain-containing protein n=1 Tax=Streptomyces sp. NPDC101213 TaxID=3366130 RepID=UPI0038292B43